MLFDIRKLVSKRKAAVSLCVGLLVGEFVRGNIASAYERLGWNTLLADGLQEGQGMIMPSLLWFLDIITSPFAYGFVLAALLFAFWDPLSNRLYSRIRNWEKIDRIEAFRLGQWAAIICGYNYPKNISDDPGGRPWRDEYFYLKRAIQAGKFKLEGGSKDVQRETLVRRAEITAFYNNEGIKPAALFPDTRG